MEQASITGAISWGIGIGAGVVFAAVIGFVVLTITPALDERDDSRRTLPRSLRWQVLVAGLCAGLLAALFALDLDNTEVRDAFSPRSIVSATVTGILLLGIALLVAEALVARARERDAKMTLRGASGLVMVSARRGAGDVAAVLRHANGERWIVRTPLPKPKCEPALMAAEAARESHQALVESVGLAVTLAAPAGGHQLAASAIELLQASHVFAHTMKLYATGRERLFKDGPPTGDDVKRDWAEFAQALLDFNSRRGGFELGWRDQLEVERYTWLKDELNESCKWLHESGGVPQALPKGAGNLAPRQVDVERSPSLPPQSAS
jgi:hypothetical protein